MAMIEAFNQLASTVLMEILAEKEKHLYKASVAFCVINYAYNCG